jgi:three-Cys-motif partner protein
MRESIVGPWARDKLERLHKYLNAYTTIMHKQSFAGYHYIDAFAGPGMHTIRPRKSSAAKAQRRLIEPDETERENEERRQYLAGSPRIALNLRFPFSNYVFVERSPERVAALQVLQREFGKTRRILIRQADCTQYLRDQVANNPGINWRSHRAIVFLDPFGMQVRWDVIEDLAKTKAVEVFLNFPVGMAIQRLMLRRPERFTDARRRLLDEYLGSPDWFSEIYRKNRTLFGEDEQQKVEHSGTAIVRWYRDRLSRIFAHVSGAALIKNTRDAHLYYLLLASHSKIGVKIANDILSAGELIT